MVGIDEDYFVDVPPDPDDDELASVIETLRELTGGDEREFVTGIEDAYHDLLVGPCDEETAEREAGACRYVQEILVGDESDFGCSYLEWSEHLRGEVIRAPDAQRHHPPAYDVDAGEIKRAQDEGLADGTRIIPRADGWIVVDNDGFRLDDADTCTWVAEEDEDDDREQPLVFPSPEDAYAAYMAAMAVAKACSRRREEALKRLAEAGGHVQQ